MKKYTLLLLLLSCDQQSQASGNCQPLQSECRPADNKIFTCASNQRWIMTQDCNLITPGTWVCTGGTQCYPQR